MVMLLDLKRTIFCFICLIASLPRFALAEVVITEDVYEDRPQFKIVTSSATYFMDQQSGGFSKVLDRDGKDWVAFKKDPLKKVPDSAAAGFRGIPNMVFGSDNPEAGAGHPGFDQCVCRVVDKQTIETRSKSGEWKWVWSFTDSHATLHLQKVPVGKKYWFLYEGPIAGRWSPTTHYFGTNVSGPRFDKPATDSQMFDHWRWIYFGDQNSPRVLLFAQQQPDDLEDTLWFMGSSSEKIQAQDGMTVFGFGRAKGSKPLMTDATQKFHFGFVEQKVESAEGHNSVASIADAWLTESNPAHAQVTVRDETLFNDMECFRVETPTATYLYGKKGAGFASIFDVQGNDWISYRHGGKAAGEYRGLPKCGQPTKLFHCGYSFGQYKTENVFESEAEQSSHDHLKIVSKTKDGASHSQWDFYPTHATMTLFRIGQPKYWFLYEGTPGGKLDAEIDYVVRPGNRRTNLTEPWKDNVPWVYFEAQESKSAFFLIQHQRHESVDSYVSWPYKPEANGSYQEMTVFGFGRPNWQDPNQHSPPLVSLPARFTIGFTENHAYDSVAKTIENIVAASAK